MPKLTLLASQPASQPPHTSIHSTTRLMSRHRQDAACGLWLISVIHYLHYHLCQLLLWEIVYVSNCPPAFFWHLKYLRFECWKQGNDFFQLGKSFLKITIQSHFFSLSVFFQRGSWQLGPRVQDAALPDLREGRHQHLQRVPAPRRELRQPGPKHSHVPEVSQNRQGSSKHLVGLKNVSSFVVKYCWFMKERVFQSFHQLQKGVKRCINTKILRKKAQNGCVKCLKKPGWDEEVWKQNRQQKLGRGQAVWISEI